MSESYLTEAFKQMELLESESFDLNKKGISELDSFLEDDVLDDFETIIDPKATNEDELESSYIGKVILGCDVCHSMIYKDPSEVKVDEESQLANIGELCPYCFTGDGYKVVGKVAPFKDITVEAGEGVDVRVDGKPVETEVKEEEVVEESLEQSQKYPIDVKETKAVNEKVDFKSKKKPLKEGLSNIEKLYAAFPELKVENKVEESCEEKIEESFKSDTKVKDIIDKEDYQFGKIKDDITLTDVWEAIKKGEDPEFVVAKDGRVDSVIREQIFNAIAKTFNISYDEVYDTWMGKETVNEGLIPKQKHPVKSPIAEKVEDSEKLTESMEDISITTEDEIIKIKATPRADKETIEPVTEEEVKEMASEEETVEETPAEKEPIEETPIEEVNEPEENIEMDEIDEDSINELGESYLKKVYENINGFKTLKPILRNDKMIIEGLISFKSGKKAKTKFIFESVAATKRGKIKLLGLNENITQNKKAFTLIGEVKDKKLIVESLNYNYSSADPKTGKSKRLYGTVKTSK